jgi:hypothetical protein
VRTDLTNRFTAMTVSFPYGRFRPTDRFPVGRLFVPATESPKARRQVERARSVADDLRFVYRASLQFLSARDPRNPASGHFT